VHQLHWGGGTPNFLSPQQVEALWTTLDRHFQFAPNAEVSIEVNPRFLDKDYIFFLKDLVQDFINP
jgi:oxygen-independent coproporphyrinogen III oxidase